MLRKKKVVGPHGGDDKTGSSKEDMEESWEMVAMEKDELELLTRKPTQEDIEASMAAGQESWVVGKEDHGIPLCVLLAQASIPVVRGSRLFAALACQQMLILYFVCDMLMCLWRRYVD